MRVGFHFDESTVRSLPDLFPLQSEQIVAMRALLSRVPAHRRHLRVRAGLPGAGRALNDPEQRRRVEDQLWNGLDCWSTFADSDDLLNALRTSYCSVVLVEGVAPDDAIATHLELAQYSGYLGVMQVRLDHVPQASYYRLPLTFRLAGSSAEILLTLEMDPEVRGSDDRDHAWRESAQQALGDLGVAVEFAYIGMQETIFDPYNNPETGRVLGEAERLLTTYVSGLVDDVMIRSRDVDPELPDVLAAALKALESHDGSEQLAHVALSCRRALTKLADILYPPRSGNGARKLGSEAYRNRLWAYAEERLTSDTRAAVVLTTLTDVGKRIDALDAAANKGLHSSIEAQDTQRLVLSLLLLIYDFMTLSPPTGAPATTYERQIATGMRDLMLRSTKPTD